MAGQKFGTEGAQHETWAANVLLPALAAERYRDSRIVVFSSGNVYPLRKVKDGGWKVEGKAWKDGDKEPSAWMVSFDEKEQPVAGRASIWGSPYATTPIRFDDLLVLPSSDITSR